MICFPSPALAGHVRYYVQEELDAIRSHIPAMAAPTLVAFISGATRLVDSPQNAPLPQAFLAGPRLVHKCSIALPRTRIVSVLFRPGHLQHFFEVDVQELTNRMFPLSDVIGREADSLVEDLQRSCGFLAVIQTMERFLYARTFKLDSRRHRSGSLHLPFEGLDHTVDSLAKTLGVGRRQFERRFVFQYGMPWRDFRRLHRFEMALAAMLAPTSPHPNLAHLAQRVGYFDQAHFDHNFRSFCGYAPSQFLKALNTAVPELWPFRFDRRDLVKLTAANDLVASIQDNNAASPLL